MKPAAGEVIHSVFDALGVSRAAHEYAHTSDSTFQAKRPLISTAHFFMTAMLRHFRFMRFAEHTRRLSMNMILSKRRFFPPYFSNRQNNSRREKDDYLECCEREM